MYYPPQLGHLLDPCDSQFHASVHTRYYHIIDGKPNLTLLQQIKAIHRAYTGEDESSIRDYFER